MCSSQLPFTRFRAIVKTTCDGSRPLPTGAWESLSHRCRLPVQQDCTDARQELRSSQPGGDFPNTHEILFWWRGHYADNHDMFILRGGRGVVVLSSEYHLMLQR